MISSKVFCAGLLLGITCGMSAMDSDEAMRKRIEMGSIMSGQYALATSAVTALPLFLKHGAPSQRLYFAMMHIIASTCLGAFSGAVIGAKTTDFAKMQRYAQYAGVTSGIMLVPSTYGMRWTKRLYDRLFN